MAIHKKRTDELLASLDQCRKSLTEQLSETDKHINMVILMEVGRIMSEKAKEQIARQFSNSSVEELHFLVQQLQAAITNDPNASMDELIAALRQGDDDKEDPQA